MSRVHYIRECVCDQPKVLCSIVLYRIPAHPLRVPVRHCFQYQYINTVE